MELCSLFWLRKLITRTWVFSCVLILLMASTTSQAQTLYCGQDTGLSAKVTLSNMALRSEEFDNAAWTNSGSSTEVANAIIAPDGTLTAEQLVAPAATSGNLRGWYNTAPITVVAGTQYRWSVYMKKGTIKYGRFGPEESPSSANKVANVDLDTCQPTFYKNSGYTVTGTSVGNGWCRFVLVTSISITTGYLDIGMAPTATWDGTSYTSTTAENIYVWGASVQLASSQADYLATTSAAATLAGVCASVTTQSPTNPSKCMSLDIPIYTNTPSQINMGR